MAEPNALQLTDDQVDEIRAIVEDNASVEPHLMGASAKDYLTHIIANIPRILALAPKVEKAGEDALAIYRELVPLIVPE